MGSSTEEFPTIDTTHLWSTLKMEDDLDDDALLIELHCLIHSTSKLRFEKRAIIGDSQYTDETAEEGQAYIKKQKHPGPNFVHPNITRTDTIIAGYNSLATKYGQEHFDTFLKNLYTSYPTHDPNTSVMSYLTQLNEGRPKFHVKWAYIYDFMFSITKYFDKRGVTL
jgi:hypothetical protein